MNVKRIELNLPTGPIKICTIWDFVKEIKREELHKDVLNDFRVAHFSYPEPQPYYRHTGLNAGEMYATTTHLLKQNPSSIVKELKKTSTNVERRSKNVGLQELLYEFSIKSMEDMGFPTHFFSVGQNRYALLCEQDVVFFIDKNYKQSIVCTNPKRNFILYVPNLRFSV